MIKGALGDVINANHLAFFLVLSLNVNNEREREREIQNVLLVCICEAICLGQKCNLQSKKMNEKACSFIHSINEWGEVRLVEPREKCRNFPKMWPFFIWASSRNNSGHPT